MIVDIADISFYFAISSARVCGHPAQAIAVEVDRRGRHRHLFVSSVAMWLCASAGAETRGPGCSTFHQQLNAEDYEGICSNASDVFGTTQSHDELIEVLGAVHKKLGNAGESSFTNIRVEKNTRGTFTTTSYETTFDHGKATERFTWVNDSGVLKLYGYHIESNALIRN